MFFPVIETLDEAGNITECAVIEEKDDSYIVKPLNDLEDFEKGWKEIPTNDLSVQLTNRKFDATSINRSSYNKVRDYLQKSLQDSLTFKS